MREVEVDAFWIDSCAVSNQRFAAFADATQYVTDAERYGWSFVFGGLLPDEFPDTRGVVQAPWWRQVFGACWRQPEGPHSSIEERPDHPVVHVSWRDAKAFCEWSDTRLPSEAGVGYWRAIATRKRSSGVIRWSRSSAASSMSIWTHSTLPVKSSFGPRRSRR